MVYKYDFLIIGSGVAGMSYALQVANSGKGKVALLCKTTMEEANTAKAQGGIASVTNLLVDNFEKHIEDTMIAGDYISDPEAVKQVVENAPAAIQRLVRWGVNFDKNEQGDFDLHREGGHSEFRILHHADDTGAEIQRGLMAAVKANPNINVLENHFAVEIITGIRPVPSHSTLQSQRNASCLPDNGSHAWLWRHPTLAQRRGIHAEIR